MTAAEPDRHRPTILVLAAYEPEIMAQLEDRFEVHRTLPEPSIGDAVAPVVEREFAPDVLRRTRCLATDPGRGARADLLAMLPSLEIISSVGVGLDTFDLDLMHERGIALTNTPDVLTDDVADLAIGLIIAGSRGMIFADRFVRDGRWLTENAPVMRQVTGKTLGILGLGRIGKAIAHRAKAFDMRILYSGTGAKPDVDYEFIADPADLAKRCDILVLSCKGGPETAGLVDARVLASLGPDGMLVNVARGSVVDEPALIAALRDGKLGFAALDVFATEPDVSEALLALPNVIVQPHHGSATVETRNRMAQLAVDNLIAHIDGRPLLTPVTNGTKAS